MTQLTIGLKDNRTEYKPGEILTGTVSWAMQRNPKSVEVRLFWYTSGKGTTDTCLVSRQVFDSPNGLDQRKFQIEIPNGPYSFSGKLISLRWGLELVVNRGKEVQRVDLTVSPTGQEVRI